MVDFERVMYFDADTLAVKDGIAAVAAAADLRHRSIACARDIYGTRWAETFNMGVVLVRPSDGEFRRLFELMAGARVKYDVRSSEQGFLNAVYDGNWTALPCESLGVSRRTRLRDIALDRRALRSRPRRYGMNANLAVLPASNLGEAFWASQKPELRLIHYTTRKPWECGHVEKVYAKVCETWQRYELESRGPRQPVEAAGSGATGADAIAAEWDKASESKLRARATELLKRARSAQMSSSTKTAARLQQEAAEALRMASRLKSAPGVS